MEPNSKKAADRVIKHREDGEEAIKRSSKVVPIDAGKNTGSVQSTTTSKSETNENDPARREGE